MVVIHTLTILICLAALFSYLNHRVLKLPMTIGLMAVALGFSLILLTLGKLGFGIEAEAQMLNAVLFVLVGLEVLVLSFQQPYLLAGLVAIPVVLGARRLSVVLQIRLFSLVRDFTARAVTILT